jgi:predicted O-methyltransferase YrrM
MSQDLFAAVDQYIDALFVPADPTLDAVIQSTIDAGMPQIQISPGQGRLLYLLAKLCGARRILELGTLAGYSTIWLGRALPTDGRLVSLEFSPAHAQVARANLARAGLAELAEVRVGPALDGLAQLVARGEPPFDLVFIDADKPNYPAYLDWALRLARPGAMILADNVVRGAGMLDPNTSDASAQAARAFNAALAANPRVEAIVLQQIGARGHDGLAIARVRD